MPSLASLSDPKSYHILAYGTLLGSNIFQSFLAGPLAFKALPRPQFSTLQSAIFPPYFSFQTALPIVLALTWPGEKFASVGGAAARQNAGPFGLMEGDNLWAALVPIAVMFATSALNLVWLGPMTTKVMKQRKHQGTHVFYQRIERSRRFANYMMQRREMARNTTTRVPSLRTCNVSIPPSASYTGRPRCRTLLDWRR